ncbi:kh domain protein [Moesziomyces antarcticus]|uniref:Kh domain protein n=2 Tax=Pseudozyma antarctica TaxID=84753 RepID=A0A081CHJ9_PSEA2|nr:kh domain protein [Moesziomyces antarcticus]GAK66145.1 kh domain protein [Moesziomyces antarcticus]SPO46922.1 probable KH domain protein [Moesziomyces antarcticus]
MDLYSTSFTIPRSVGASSFVSDAAANASAPSNSAPGFGNDVLRNATNVGARAGPAASPAQEAPASSLPGRFTSMRSRFPPSVKAFMPSAFGGKRTSERIVEAVGAEKAEADASSADAAAKSSSASAAKDVETSAPLAPIGERGNARPSKLANDGLANPDDLAASQHRDSRSTVGTRSSFDLSSNASFIADSTAPSSAVGGNPSSATHSASNSISANQHDRAMTNSQSSKDLQDAIQKLSSDVMANHQCLVSFAPVPQPDESRLPSTPLTHPFQRQSSFSSLQSLDQLPFPNPNAASSSGYPYQQYHPQPIGTPDSHSSAFFTARSTGEALGAGFPGLNSSSLSLSSLNPQSATGSHVAQEVGLSSAQSLRSPQSAAMAASRASLSGVSKPPQYNFHLSGGFQHVMNARGAILRENPFKLTASIKVPRADVFDIAPGSSPPGKESVKADIRRKLDEVQTATGATLTVKSNDVRGADLGYGLETERMIEVLVSGPFESVELARVKALVIFDEITGLRSEICEIDYKLHNIIGGRKRCVVQKIEEETGTNIYLPSSFLGTFGSTAAGRAPALAAQQNQIHITGEFFGVQRARDMLFQVSMHKSKGIISRDAAILPRKLDWMLTERLEELRSIMMDNGTYVAFPLLGSQTSVISVFGDHRVNIERTIRSIMQLACQFYVASLWLLPVGFDVYMPSQANLNPTQVAPVLKHVSSASGAEVVFKSNCFEIHGLESEVRTAVSALLDLDLIKSFNFEVRFQIELANEHREFISGKKNGKVNKVMKQCGVRIKFETFNDYNFLIDVSGNDRNGVLQGLGLLQEELPAEISFHVPEAYHKRIIGVGGKNIQRIMKKFGVYVKFSNAEEFAALGGYLDNEDNVIARTPAKNAANLENLKLSVMELVSPKDKDYISETVTISRRYHRTLLGEKAIFIHDIESKTSSSVRFPARESASDLLTIFGPESQIHIAAQMLLDHVPFEAEFRAPNSPELAQAIQLPEFATLTEQLKRDLSIAVSPVIEQRRPGGEAVFKLRLNRSNTDFLPTAKDAIEDFLINHNANIYAAPSRTRSDSFASAFPHFANKLISTAAAAESNESFQNAAAAAAAAEQARVNERRLRAAASTPDIKALFDSPAQHLHGGPGFPTTNGVSSATAANSPMIPSSLYASPYGNGRGFGSDVWGMPTRGFAPSATSSATPSLIGLPAPAMGTASAGLPSPAGPGPIGGAVPNSSGGIQFPSQPLHHQGANPRLSDELHMNRGVEGMSMEERVKALRKPRSFAHRAQSLDIGAMAAQQASQHASGSMSVGPSTPYGLGPIGTGAPTHFPGHVGAPSGFAAGPAHHLYQSAGQQPSPHDAQAGFGLNSHAAQPHHLHAASASISRLPPGRNAANPDASTMDEVSRVLAQLAFDRA